MGHPESQYRLLAISDMLRETHLIDELEKLQPRDATQEEICLVHDPRYFEIIKSTSGKPRVFLDTDTSTCPLSFAAAVRAAGGMLSAVESILDKEIDMAFPMVRPPGHHAERNRAMGFCLFNNIAIGASYITKIRNFKRVLIVDWDLHHGNGTQNMFYDSSEVLYFSTHQYPHYPGTGSLREVGIGDGAGYNINVPLPEGMGDTEYTKIFFEILGPVIEQFRPEFILVSAGFDAYFEDPLGGMNLTPNGFAQLTRFLNEAAEIHSGGNIIFILEGGYNLEGLWLSTKEVIEELIEKKKTSYPETDVKTRADSIIADVKSTHSQFWKF
ncbi:MAG: histone deacetylase [Deltaproteobacteria bacterium]|nr:histone deacetylase [Deltaproteobacteria bacterium]